MPNVTDPVSLRFKPEFHQRLQEAADSVGIPKHTLCQQAVMAAVEAIEEAKGKIVMPIKFEVQALPKPRKSKR